MAGRIRGNPSGKPPELVTESFARRLRQALVELGPTFIKFGQILSDRKDLLPPSIIVELERLQDNVPSFPTDEAERIIAESLGAPVDHLFLFFNSTPEAAASLAQVHRAILPSGRTVAVKIKRPGIEEQVRADIHIMHQLAGFLDHNTSYFGVISAEEIVAEFERQMLKELNFKQEFLNIKRFREQYLDDETVLVPTAYEEYATEDLLVMDFVHGLKVSDVIRGRDGRFDKKTVNKRTADFIMSQLFINGFFHADPHPGNFMVLEGNVICFIDFGMVYSLRPYELENLNYLILGLAQLDPALVARSLLRMGRAEGRVERDAFIASVYDYIESHLDKPIQYIDVSGAVVDLLQMVISFGVQLPARLVYVTKVLGILQSICAGLDPEFRLIEYIREFSPKLWINQFTSRNAGNKLLLSQLNWGETFIDAPVMLQDLGKLLKEPEIKLTAPEFERVRVTFDKVGFRLVFGLVLSALLISSSLMVLADIEPKLYGIPVFGIIGFGIGGIMGIVFLFVAVIKLFRWRKY
jgi:ubiquinone biosynthesis protein